MGYDPEYFWNRRAEHPDLIGGGKRKKVQKGLDLEFETLSRWCCYYRPNEVLDVGCAEGRLLQCFRRKGIELNMTMCDISDGYRERCVKETGMLPDRWDGRTLPYSDESFDLVVSANVLLHVEPSLVSEVWNEHIRVARRYLYITTTIKRYAANVVGHFCHDYLCLFENSQLTIREEAEFGGQRMNWWLEK